MASCQALSLDFLACVTIFMLFKHSFVSNLISLFLFSLNNEKEIFSKRLKLAYYWTKKENSLSYQGVNKRADTKAKSYKSREHGNEDIEVAD